MKRRFVMGAISLGIFVSVIGGTGIFGVFADRGPTKANSLSSADLRNAANVQITRCSGSGYDASGRRGRPRRRFPVVDSGVRLCDTRSERGSRWIHPRRRAVAS